MLFPELPSMKLQPVSTSVLLIAALVVGISACRQATVNNHNPVKEVMDGVVTRLYQSHTSTQLDTLSEAYILKLLTDSEEKVLATRYWTFDVNVPVTVSLMRHKDQKTLPFWLLNSGFRKTDLLVKNEEYTYEVWQKKVDAGRVELGINGFDKHRPVYFISVGPQNPVDKLLITNAYPDTQTFDTLQVGAFTYHDWDDLTLTEVPASLRGQVLFTTIRGRAREAHLIGAFRKTPFPSSPSPDQLLLTWSGDPTTTIDVQWRTNQTGADGQTIQYWQATGNDTISVSATSFLMEDRLLQNDRYVHRFTAHLKGLQAGTTYNYRVGSKASWSRSASFTTQGSKPEKFSFIWFGDTHKSEQWGNMAKQAAVRHPESAFYSIAGDLVSTGLHRDEWDELWQYSGEVFHHKPLMPIPGNHDSQDGLGAWMYQEMFSLPKNGPKNVPVEQTYAFTYQNALFLMIDATSPIEQQTAWIKDQLANTKADWKFAFFHFPPYNYEEDYALIRKEWCSLFDQYHVDMVMSGHVHYYMRTKPIYAEKPVESPANGTIYTISVGIPSRHDHMLPEAYAVIRDPSGLVYQHIRIDGKTMYYTCYDSQGTIKDELKLTK